MKILEGQEDAIKLFLPAALAMAIHDDEIWQTLSGQWQISSNGQINTNYQQYIINVINPKQEGIVNIIKEELTDEAKDDEAKDIEIAKNLYAKKGSWESTLYKELVGIVQGHPLNKLCFEKQPVAFLLILCDNLQDCGRPCQNEEKNTIMKLTDIRLKDVNFQQKSQKLTIRLSFVNTPDCSVFMQKKKKTLEQIRNFLYSEQIKFIIEFEDRISEKEWFNIEIPCKKTE